MVLEPKVGLLFAKYGELSLQKISYELTDETPSIILTLVRTLIVRVNYIILDIGLSNFLFVMDMAADKHSIAAKNAEIENQD